MYVATRQWCHPEERGICSLRPVFGGDYDNEISDVGMTHPLGQRTEHRLRHRRRRSVNRALLSGRRPHPWTGQSHRALRGPSRSIGAATRRPAAPMRAISRRVMRRSRISPSLNPHQVLGHHRLPTGTETRAGAGMSPAINRMGARRPLYIQRDKSQNWRHFTIRSA